MPNKKSHFPSNKLLQRNSPHIFAIVNHCRITDAQVLSNLKGKSVLRSDRASRYRKDYAHICLRYVKIVRNFRCIKHYFQLGIKESI